MKKQANIVGYELAQQIMRNILKRCMKIWPNVTKLNQLKVTNEQPLKVFIRKRA